MISVTSLHGIVVGLFDFGGEHKVAFGQAVDFVGEEGYPRLLPGQGEIGVVVLRFGQHANPVDKIQGLLKIREIEFLFEVMSVHHAPVMAQFPMQFGQFPAFEWRHPAPARHAFLPRQCVTGITCHDNILFVSLTDVNPPVFKRKEGCDRKDRRLQMTNAPLHVGRENDAGNA